MSCMSCIICYLCFNIRPARKFFPQQLVDAELIQAVRANLQFLIHISLSIYVQLITKRSVQQNAAGAWIGRQR